MNFDNKGFFNSLIGEYNPKVDYLFCRHIFLTYGESNDEAIWRKCWNEDIETFSVGSRAMMEAKNLLLKVSFALENKESVDSIFEILTINNELKESFREAYIKAQNEDLSASDEFLIKCIKKKNEYDGMINEKVAHAVLCVLAKHIPTVFYSGQFKNILRFVKTDEERALQTLYLARTRTESLNEKHIDISCEEVISRILSCKEYLKETYGINEVYIYGSYSKGDPSLYSDLDIFAVADVASLLVAEGALAKISATVGIPVDGHIVDSKEKDKLYLTPEIRRWLKKVY